MNIRLAEITDAQALSRLLAEVWKATYQGIFPRAFLEQITSDKWVEGFQHTLTQNLSPIFVAEVDSQIVGMISGGKARDTELQIPFEIYALNISPTFQRQHIGQLLMAYLVKQMKIKEGEVYLRVASKNLNARYFYEKQGFVNSGIITTRKIENFYFEEMIYTK